MSDKKIIIRNCPALSFSLGFYCDEYQKKCQDVTNCVMKQIVERLLLVMNSNLCQRCDGCNWENGCADRECGYYQANEILKFLDIQESE